MAHLVDVGAYTATQGEEAIRSQQAVSRSAWREMLAPAALIAALGLFNLLTLMRAPAVFWDEAWNTSRAWALLQTGRPFSPLDGDILTQFPGYWTVFPLIGTAIHAASLAIFGPDLFAVRIVSWLCGLGLLAVVYAVARQLYGGRVGLLAVVLVGFSFPFLYSSHLGRHDIIVALIGYGAIALYLRDRSHGFSLLALISGLILGLALDIHLNIIIFGLALGGLYLWEYRLAAFTSKRCWSFVAGGVLGAGYFLVFHVFAYPNTYFAVLSAIQSASRTPPFLTLDAGVWANAFATTAVNLNLLALLFLIAVVYLARRRLPADRRLLAASLSVMVTFTLVISPKQPFYSILLAPIIGLVLAPLVGRIVFQKWPSNLRTLLGVALLFGLLATSLLHGLSIMLLTDYGKEVAPTMAAVQQAIPPGSRVIGRATYWLGLSDRKLTLWDQVYYEAIHYNRDSLEASIRPFDPQYLIVDKSVADFADLQQLVSTEGSLVGTVPTESFGTVRIYRMDWK